MECPTFPDWPFLPVSVREECAVLGAAVLPLCDICRWKSCLGLPGGVGKPGIGEQWDGVLVSFSVEECSKGLFSLTAHCIINSGRHLCIRKYSSHTAWRYRVLLICFSYIQFLRTHLGDCGRVSLVLAPGLPQWKLCLGGFLCWAAAL